MVTSWPDAAATKLLAQLVEHLDQDLVHARALRRELHRHPDLSGAERPTAERMRHALPNLRATRVADTGFMVRVGPPGPAVAIRAELDALPLVERTGVEWAATNGAMHACGHDTHSAMLASAAAMQRTLTPTIISVPATSSITVIAHTTANGCGNPRVPRKLANCGMVSLMILTRAWAIKNSGVTWLRTPPGQRLGRPRTCARCGSRNGPYEQKQRPGRLRVPQALKGTRRVWT